MQRREGARRWRSVAYQGAEAGGRLGVDAAAERIGAPVVGQRLNLVRVVAAGDDCQRTGREGMVFWRSVPIVRTSGPFNHHGSINASRAQTGQRLTGEVGAPRPLRGAGGVVAAYVDDVMQPIARGEGWGSPHT